MELSPQEILDMKVVDNSVSFTTILDQTDNMDQTLIDRAIFRSTRVNGNGDIVPVTQFFADLGEGKAMKITLARLASLKRSKIVVVSNST